MRIIIAIVLLGLCSMSAAHVSFRDAQIVFNKLTHEANYYPKLRYSPDLDSNAWTDENIYINQGMLNDCRNYTDLSMVLGHELGHYIKNDPRFKAARFRELRADKIGYYFCKKTGYSHCIRFMYMMNHKYKNDYDDVHPKWSIRIKEVLK